MMHYFYVCGFSLVVMWLCLLVHALFTHVHWYVVLCALTREVLFVYVI
jgi:hypothetical protein